MFCLYLGAPLPEAYAVQVDHIDVSTPTFAVQDSLSAYLHAQRRPMSAQKKVKQLQA